MVERVLIVDDSGLIRKCIRRFLEQSGLAVEHFFEASNGAEALRVLELQKVDLLVTDISMPEMDGVEMLRALQDIPGSSSIHKIVISSIATDKWADELHELGVAAVLAKPPDMAELIRALRDMKLVES
ncbi:MAG: response regulator [Planctomycetota bacterium]|jgi:YesN/AraC family two-component response regulator|nr:response regulator [Planctomycetota bacterium]